MGHSKDFDFGLRFMRRWRIFISKIILSSDLYLKNVPLAFVGRPEIRQEGQLKTAVKVSENLDGICADGGGLGLLYTWEVSDSAKELNVRVEGKTIIRGRPRLWSVEQDSQWHP